VNGLTSFVVGQWRRPSVVGQALLRPMAWLFAGLAAARRWSYRSGLKRSRRLPVPVIVIGNLTVGGSGKTPLVGYLTCALVRAGWRPGIVSRGYGRTERAAVRLPATAADPRQYGDEPVLLAAETGCPVAVGADRPAAAALLLDDCDVILSDDGLQHYALARDIEIVVIDGASGLGNGRLLPAGPLREPVSRLSQVDYVAVRDGEWRGAWRYRVDTGGVCHLVDQRRTSLAAWYGVRVHAVAGIGHPGRFFRGLEDAGLEVVGHAFGDHHRFQKTDFAFGDEGSILMTDKDAVKCRAFADDRMWAVEAQVTDYDGLADAVCQRLTTGGRRSRGPSTA